MEESVDQEAAACVRRFEGWSFVELLSYTIAVEKNLTVTQTRCTELLEEAQELRARYPIGQFIVDPRLQEWPFSVLLEKHDADKKYGPFASTHEAYGVLKEEVDELWKAIKNWKGDQEPTFITEGFRKSMVHEATQIAAVCLRIIEQAGSFKR